MNAFAKLIPSALAAAALAVASMAPALAIHDAEDRPARMVGAGSVAFGDGSVRVAVDLPCPGEDVGFNPQPDPPGLEVTWADNSFRLDAVTAASCSNNLHEGSGVGTCGDEAGFIIDWSLADGDRAGLGGPDTVELDIRSDRDACPLSVAGPLERGNLQFIGNPNDAPEVRAAHWVNGGARAPVPQGTGCNNAGYTTIQAAVDAASPGDTVLVCPGTYTENVVILTGDLTVASTDGAAVTTVEAPAVAAPYLAALGYNHVFYIRATAVTVDGFTVVPAGTADPDIGINLALEGGTGVDTDARLVNNDIVGGRIGINLGCAGFGTSVDHNTLGAQTEGGINIDTCEMPPFPGSHHNSIHHNTACGATLTASIALGGSSNHNRIHHNTATSISVFGTGNVVHHNTTQLAVVDSGSGNSLHNNTTDPAACP